MGGTLVGGALGFLSMMHPALATNPYALLAIICAATFAVGLASAAQLRVRAGASCRYNHGRGSEAGPARLAAASSLASWPRILRGSSRPTSDGVDDPQNVPLPCPRCLPSQVAIVLSLMTLASLVLCQYQGCCGAATGSLEVFLARALSVTLGCLAAAAVSNLVAPWFASQESLGALAGVLRQCSALMGEMYGEARRAVWPAAGPGGLLHGRPLPQAGSCRKQAAAASRRGVVEHAAAACRRVL